MNNGERPEETTGGRSGFVGNPTTPTSRSLEERVSDETGGLEVSAPRVGTSDFTRCCVHETTLEVNGDFLKECR